MDNKNTIQMGDGQNVRKQKNMESFACYMSYVAKKLRLGQKIEVNGRIWVRKFGGFEVQN